MLILQEFIKKKGEVALQGFSINDGNDVFMPFKCEYIRYYSESYGHYMKFSPFNDEALINKIHALFKKTRFNGIFEVEFMKNENDELLFLEINLRPSAWNYAMTFGGANLPYFWMKSVLAGKIVSEEINLRKTPYTAMSELDDFTNNVIHGKLSLFTWLKEFIKCDCTYLSNKSDRKPMANLLLTLFKNKFIK
jgi:D-aspartate ligase